MADYIIQNGELMHYGIKGMRWGVRKKGKTIPSYTAEAKKMSDQELRQKIDRMNLEKRYLDMTKTSKLSKSMDATKNAAAVGSNASKTASNVAKLKGNKNDNLAGKVFDVTSKSASAIKKVDSIVSEKSNLKKNKPKVDGLSDSELRNAVNRMDLEQQYSRLKSGSVNRGKVKASDILSIAGDVMAIGASASAIALAIYNVKHK